MVKKNEFWTALTILNVQYVTHISKWWCKRPKAISIWLMHIALNCPSLFAEKDTPYQIHSEQRGRAVAMDDKKKKAICPEIFSYSIYSPFKAQSVS